MEIEKLVTVHDFLPLLAPAVKQGFFTSPRCKIGGFLGSPSRTRHLLLFVIGISLLIRHSDFLIRHYPL